MCGLKENMVNLCYDRIDEAINELRNQARYQEVERSFEKIFKSILEYLPKEYRKELYDLEEIISARDSLRWYTIYKQGLADYKELAKFIGGV